MCWVRWVLVMYNTGLINYLWHNNVGNVASFNVVLHLTKLPDNGNDSEWLLLFQHIWDNSVGTGFEDRELDLLHQMVISKPERRQDSNTAVTHKAPTSPSTNKHASPNAHEKSSTTSTQHTPAARSSSASDKGH